MRLPPELNHAIQQELEKIGTGLSQAVHHLAGRYKGGHFSSPVITTSAHRAAYLAVRVPATFAANLHVFSEIRRLASEAEIKSILDLGSGPGTSAYAAAQVFPGLNAASMVEADGALLDLGRQLSHQSSHPAVRHSSWLQQDLKAAGPLDPHDLVVISYALNELPVSLAEKVVQEAWQRTREFLAIIEPGTVRGFGFVHAARTRLITEGAHILAPCPDACECPMAAAGDWCHFAQRVERTSLHRRLKAGALGYEDEKFSYVVASRNQYTQAQARIVRHPQKHSGHVQLALCTMHGLETRTVTQSQKQEYKLARKADWGDEWRECRNNDGSQQPRKLVIDNNN